MLQAGRRDRGGKQDVDQDVIEMREETEKRIAPRRRGQAVRSMSLEPVDGFRFTQTRATGVERYQHVVDRQGERFSRR